MKKTILAITIVALFVVTITLPAGADQEVKVQKTEIQAQTVVEDGLVYRQFRGLIWLYCTNELKIDWQKKIGNYYLDATITGISDDDDSAVGPLGNLWEWLYSLFGIDTCYYFGVGDDINIRCSVLHAPDGWGNTLFAGGYNVRVFE